MFKLYLSIAPSSRVIIIISLQIKLMKIKSSTIYKSITAISSLTELLCSALEITVLLIDNSYLISCITGIQSSQQRLMLR